MAEERALERAPWSGWHTTMAHNTTRLSWEQALAWRMKRHRLVERAAPSDLLSVVSQICGLHAQLMSTAELSLWARIEGLGREALQEKLWKHRTLVKLWAMRGTLHVLPSEELGVWVSALSTYTNRGMTGHPKLDVLTEAVGRALEGRVLTREELALAVEQITGVRSLSKLVHESWGWPLKPASFRGRLCFAAGDGTRVRFTAPTTWIRDEINKRDWGDALCEVTRRFLAAYAPVTIEDLARWWGVGPARGRRMLAAVGQEAVQVDVEGQPAWVLARDMREMASAKSPNTARLLPAFDPWVIGALIGKPIGARCSEVLLGPGRRAHIFSPQGWVSPALLVNGRIAGVWSHAGESGRLSVKIAPFGKLPAWAGRQFQAEAERLAEFLDCKALSFTRMSPQA